MMQDAALRRDFPALLAVVGCGLVVVGVPLAPGRVEVGPVPIDSVILSVFAAIVLSLPYLRRVGVLGLTRTGLEAPAALFLSWALLGIAFTGGGSGEVLTWSRYAAYILLVVVIGTVAREPRNRRILMWGFVFAGSVTAFHGVIEYVRPRSGIGMQGLDIQIATRVASTFENPNFFGEFLVLLFAATLALALTEKRFWRIAAVGLLLGQTMALFFTYTRGSWVGLAIGLVVALLLVEARLVLPFILAGVVLVPFVPGAMSRISSIFSIEGTTSFRLRLWRVAGASIEAHPVFGSGIGNFYDAFQNAIMQNPALQVGFLFYGAHNSYFQLTAETGVIGGLAFVWLVFAVCRMGAYYNRRIVDDRPAALANAALTAGLIAFSINALTSNSFQHPRAAVFFWVLAGMQAAIGAEWFGAPAHETAVAQPHRSVVTVSFASRAIRAVSAFFSRIWRGSLTFRAIGGPPPGDGGIVVNSRLARVVAGDDPDS